MLGPSDVQNLRQIFAPVQLLYAISAGLPGHGGANYSITGPAGVATGPNWMFTGSGVTQGGAGDDTFTFSGGGHGATTLSAPFTIPAVNQTGTMSVTDGTAFVQNSPFLIPNGATVDQQGYVGRVVSNGGTNTLTVITVSLGTYSAAGTIASGTAVSWGDAPTIYAATPTISQYATNTASGNFITLTLSATPTPGDTMFAVITWAPVARTITPPLGWTLIATQDTTGAAQAYVASYYRVVQAGDGTTYTWSFTSGGTAACGYLAEVVGANVNFLRNSITYNAFNETGDTPPVQPVAPNSLVLAYTCIGNGGVGGIPTGWTELVFLDNGSSIGQLVITQGPPSTMEAIAGATIVTDENVSGLLVIPPASGGGGSGASGAGITAINAQYGPAISVLGSSYIGISTLTNQIEVINTGLWSVTGPSYTASDTGIVFTGPNVLQTAPNTFYISVAGAAGGGGGGSGSYPPTAYDTNRLAIGSLINYWPLNELAGTTAFDKKGSTNLTYAGTGVTYGSALGMSNNDVGVNFDGVAGAVKGTPSMPTVSSGFTVEWVSTIAVIPSSSGLSFLGGFNVSTLEGFNVNSSTPSGAFPQKVGGNAGALALTALSTSAEVPGFYELHVWHFIYDGANAFVFCNNNQMSKTAVTAWTQANFLAFGAVSVAGTLSGFMPGTFAKCALYNAVLTDAQRGAALRDLRHS